MTQGDRGATLIEVLIAIVILGTVFAAILGAIATSIIGSDIHRREASANAILVSAAEAIADNGRNPYQNCDSGVPSYDPSKGVSVPANYLLKMTSVQVWDGGGVGTPDASSPDGWQLCPATDVGLQQVRLSVAATDGRATETIKVLKRRPT